MNKSTYLLLEEYMISCMGDSAHDKEHIISILEKINAPGDVILLKASNGMKFYDLAERMINLWKRKN